MRHHVGTRLLLVTPDFPPATGGIQHLLGEVVRRLPDTHVTVCTRAAPAAVPPAALGAHVREHRGRVDRHGVALAELNARAAAVALRERPDAVLSGHVIVGPGAVLAARAARAPLVTYVHADEVPHRQRLAHVSLSRSRRVIAVSTYSRELACAAGAHRDRVRIVHPGAGSAQSVTPLNGPPSFVTVARLVDRYKGHDLMLEALARVRLTVPDVVWHVVGDGPLRSELEARASELGVADHVRFHGRVSDGERDAIVAGARAFVMPSRTPPRGAGGEGFGIVYIEAALLGVPSVAGKVGGAVDAVLHDETGLLVDPTSVEEIGAALVRLLTDDALRTRLGDAARVRAERDFNWDRIAAQVDAVLREALAD